MKQFFSLLKVDMGSMFSFWTKKRHEKGGLFKAILFGLGGLLGWGFIFYYEFLFLKMVLTFRAQLFFFLFLAFLDIIVAFIQTAKQASASLFQFKDYGLLFSMPIPVRTILLEKTIRIYLGNLLSSFLFVLPGIILFGVLGSPSFLYPVVSLAFILVLPMIPIILGALVSLLITFLSTFFRHTKIFSVLFYFLLIIGFSAVGGFIGRLTDSMSSSQMNSALSFFSKNWAFKPMIWFAQGIVNTDLVSIICFIGANLLLFILFIFLFSRLFGKINAVLQEEPKAKKVKLKLQQRSAVPKALLKKELSFLSMSASVTLNFLIGPLFFLLFSATILFGIHPFQNWISSELIESGAVFVIDFLEIFGKNEGLILFILFVAASYFLNISPLSSSLISLEGKNFWITKSLPVSIKQIFRAKYRTQFLLVFPVFLVSLICIMIALRLSFLSLILLAILIFLDTLFSGIFGLCLNLSFPKMQWEQVSKAIKRSMSVGIATVSKMIFLAGTVWLYIFLNQKGVISGFALEDGTVWFLIGFIVLQVIGIILAKLFLYRKGTKQFMNISA